MNVRLDQPFAHPPLVLAEQKAAQVGEVVGRILERPDDCLAVGDRQRDTSTRGGRGVSEGGFRAAVRGTLLSLSADDHDRHDLLHVVRFEIGGIRPVRQERAGSPGCKCPLLDASALGNEYDRILAKNLQSRRSRRPFVHKYDRANPAAIGSEVEGLWSTRIGLACCRKCHRGRSDGRQRRNASAQSAPTHDSPFVGRPELAVHPIPLRSAGQSDEPLASFELASEYESEP